MLRGETDEADIFQVKILSKTNSKNKQIDILTTDIDIHKINQVNWFDWSAYTQRAGSPILLPTDIGISRIWISDNAQKLKISKADDNTIFYYGYPIRRIENSIRKLIFFDSLHFELYDKSFSFKYNINDTFGNVLKSVQIIEALCNNNLLINDNKLSIGPIQQYEIEATLKNIRPFKNILELINIFPSLNKLREYQLTVEELNFLIRLHKEFICKDLSNYKGTECPRYVRYRIRDVSIILLYIQLNGEYLLLNPFDSQFALEPRVVIIHGDNSETAFFTSLFVSFDKAAWRDSSNLNVNTVISSITTLDLSDENQRDQISDMLLQILSAYDESKYPDLLALANKIAEQLFPIKSMEISVYLNCIQTFYRVQEGKLSSEQMEWLETTLTDAQSNKNHLIECAAYVLLSKFEKAKQAYDLLSEEEKAQIDGYPIAHLLFRKTACD
ncbi:hypothetical protein SDC9_94758 [bioreactor metagenome]|uniref:DUF4365 domain-containing protein n=1 Tax=bioreactor metagenome TaxID=1076179 RepID=A0A645A4P1_9ZZZZ